MCILLSMDRTNVFLTKEQKEVLKKLAEKKNVSMADLIRRAIDEYLKKEEKKR